MFKSSTEGRNELRENMRGGAGNITIHHMLEKEEMLGKCRLCAAITVEPGCEIGSHSHGPDAEIFFLLTGELVANDNGIEVVLKAGDVLFTGNNQVHSVKNISEETVQMLAIIIN